MRYLVVKQENSSPEVIIWTKSQHQVPVKQGITRECSHRDYLRAHKIPFENALAIGNVAYDPRSGKSNVEVLPWDAPEKHEDTLLVQKAAVSFYKAHPELKDEIQSDWNQYVAWLKRREELLGRK
ncbi:MAG: hypothetical protein J6T55_00365 [Alphaproteobacteria bacterium]|nr:hypothetical protein [Alphaproteobacteria bacterium]